MYGCLPLRELWFIDLIMYNVYVYVSFRIMILAILGNCGMKFILTP